jgi:hypothetical protein
MMLPRALRGAALAIAIAAVFDPAVTTARRADAVVAVVAADPVADAALAERVARALDGAVTVVRGPFPGADATVLAGARLPDDAGAWAHPAFAVLPAPEQAAVVIERVDAPAHSPLDARVPVNVLLRVTGAAGRAVEVTLAAGDVTLDRVTVEALAEGERVEARLSFVPAQTGPATLSVRAQLDARRGAARDLVIRVSDARWAVLFFDGRPSWMSTFVRRSLEQDPRFVVTGRVITSRGITTDFGQPPVRLEDPAALAVYDAIVVGAPETLEAADVAALERYMRRRGGAVLLLMDRRADGAYERLAGVTGWTGTGGGDAVDLGGGVLRAAELAVPVALPAGASALVTAAERGGAQPVVWRAPVGAGTLVVSGALDAWRYRDVELSGFDGYWPALIGELADASPAAVAVETGIDVALPGEWTEVRVTVRDAALVAATGDGAARTSAEALLVAGAERVPIRLWPAGPPGELVGRVRAPVEPGSYRVEVVADGERAAAPIVVAAARGDGGGDERELVTAWAEARGGAVVAAGAVDALPGLVRAALQAERRRERWHPMRSAWWIVPFAAALGGEWWWRRRRGLA